MQLTAITTAQHFIQAFSWMLIHSLWQGLLLSVVAGLLLTVGKKASSVVRYNLVLAQLLLFVIACAITFLWEWNKTPLPSTGIQFAPAPTPDAELSLKTFVNTCIAYFTANSPFIVLLWFILFLVRTVRMMGSALFINRARHRFIYQPSAEWKAKTSLLCEKLQLKRAVQLLESGYVKVPMVIGHLKPVILIPVGLLAGLPPGQVEAVLLHELAHIRRNDYMVNCLQTIVETVFFFNPGLLWISSVLRDERENCCDDIALAQTKDKKEFVQALISFKEYALSRKSYAVAFPGDKNSLLNRASRILYDQNKPLGRGEKMFFIIGLLVLSIIIATASVAQIRIAGNHKPTADTTLSLRRNTLKFTGADDKVLVVKRDTFIKNKYLSSKFAGTATKEDKNAEHRSATHISKILQHIQANNSDVFPEGQKREAHKQEAKSKEELSARRNQDTKEWGQFTAARDLDAAVRERNDKITEKNAENRDQQQVNQDQTKANKDQQQATQDEIQSKRDRAQAQLDQIQATRDQEQAKRDQAQAEKDQQQAKLQQEQAKHDEEQAKLQQEHAEHDQAQTAKKPFQKWDGQKQDVRLKTQMEMQLQIQQQKAVEAAARKAKEFNQLQRKKDEITKNASSSTSVQE